MKQASNLILLITLSNIGDAVMTTPVLQALHRLYPESKIDIISNRRSDHIFKYCPYRGDLIQKNKQAVVDLRTDGLAYLLRAEKRLTKWQADKQKKHAVEQHFSVISSLQPGIHPPPTTLWLDKTHDAYAQDTLNTLPGCRWLAIGPGCDVPEKVWPGDYYRDLANQSLDLFDAIILLGSQGDVKYAEIVTNGLKQSFINLCGETDILQAAAVLKRSSMFIGNDSGLGHIASAVSIPTVSLFGVGSPKRYHPWGRRAVWLKGDNQEIRNISVRQVANLLRAYT
jgi:ADP-heptose:LPS heptosyltransferase